MGAVANSLIAKREMVMRGLASYLSVALFGKPASTFPDHAQGRARNRISVLPLLTHIEILARFRTGTGLALVGSNGLRRGRIAATCIVSRVRIYEQNQCDLRLLRIKSRN